MKHMRRLALLIVSGVLASTAVIACGAEDTPVEPLVITSQAVLSGFSFVPSQPVLRVGDSLQLRVDVEDSEGASVPNVTVEWTSSAPAVAGIDSQGVLGGASVGSSVIRAVVRPPVGYGSTAVLQGSVVVSVSDSTTLTGEAVVELPRSYVDTSEPVTTRDIRIPNGASLQAAIDGAQRGDRLLLAPGATYGAVLLPQKTGSGWVVIQTDVQLPAGRLTPATASSLNLAVIQGGAANQPVISATGDVSYYRFQGIEIRAAPGVGVLGDLVRLATDRSVASTVIQPSYMVFDRMYVYGNPPALQLKRCFALTGQHVAVTNSSVLGCSKLGQDSQAIWSADGLGPTAILNNHLQAGSEVVMFGGADPHIAGVVPADIEIRGNYFHRPQSWKDAGIGDIKNLFEIKNAQRVLVEGNVFEGNWTHAQSGVSILIKSTNQDGNCGWCTADDLTIRWNLLDDIENGIQVMWGNSTGAPHGETERVLIEHNVLARLGGNGNNPGQGVPLRVSQMPTNVTIRNNTFENTGANLFLAYHGVGGLGANTNISDNIGWYGLWGVWVGDGATLQEGVFRDNTLIGGQGAICASNQCAETFQTETVTLAGRQYTLPVVSGKGAFLAGLAQKLQGVR